MVNLGMASSKKLPDYEYLHQLFTLDPSGALIRKTRTSARARVGQQAGNLNGGYLHVKIDGSLYMAHRIVWMMATGEDPADKHIDHINRNPLDNRVENLRPATRAENLWNTGIRATNRSGHKGVSWEAARGKWRARIRVGGKQQSLGLFIALDDARKAYADAASAYHGGFAGKV
jgi:HNH endonuclease/AP2 domain